ncbi:MAG: hypothetical protein H6936_18145 [Burkholderiales bacterium]|nr:hypothetical protein [Calditrichota bacterium]MCP5276717.1 hypothetical protein [Burkholderiales bacterium]
MKGKYGGAMHIVDELFQRLYQDRQFSERYGIDHVRAAYLYLTPCDETGQPVIIGDKFGNPVDGYISSGGYDCAADTYDRLYLEPQPVGRRTIFSPD